MLRRYGPRLLAALLLLSLIALGLRVYSMQVARDMLAILAYTETRAEGGMGRRAPPDAESETGQLTGSGLGLSGSGPGGGGVAGGLGLSGTGMGGGGTGEGTIGLGSFGTVGHGSGSGYGSGGAGGGSVWAPEPVPELVEIGEGKIWAKAGKSSGVSYNLTLIEDEPLLKEGKQGAILPLHAEEESASTRAIPLVLVHGINGRPQDMQALVQRFRNDKRYQLYIFAYDDMGRRTSENGLDLSRELTEIASHTVGELIIVAHSMGGLVTRVALNNLGPALERIQPELRPRLRVLTVDSPWHGFSGPPDRGISRLMMAMVRPMLPDGLEDMRAESEMFQTLYDTDLPPDTELRLAFAAEGDGILYWGEGKLLDLVAGLTSAGPSYEAKDPQVRNFWRALQASKDYAAFAAGLRSSHSRAEVEAALAAHFPVFPGDHTGVLAEQQEGLPEAARRWILRGSWGK